MRITMMKQAGATTCLSANTVILMMMVMSRLIATLVAMMIASLLEVLLRRSSNNMNQAGADGTIVWTRSAMASSTLAPGRIKMALSRSTAGVTLAAC